jgi:hypothetical protein
VAVEVGEFLGRCFGFVFVGIGLGKQNLPLQIADVHPVIIHNPDAADTRGGQIQQRRRAKAPRPHAQHRGLIQAVLPISPQCWQHGLACVAVGHGWCVPLTVTKRSPLFLPVNFAMIPFFWGTFYGSFG